MPPRRRILAALAALAAAPLVPGLGARAWAAAAPAALPLRGPALLMAEGRGCPSCAAFRREVLPGYAGHAWPAGAGPLPLAIVPIEGPWPDGLALARRPALSPTFILLDSRREVARLEGYPGAAGFWATLAGWLGPEAAR